MVDAPFPNSTNRLFLGDNLEVMRRLPDGCVSLIYADPPFFSGRRRRAAADQNGAQHSFDDTWAGDITSYIQWLSPRLAEMRRLLTPEGSICVHLDWHASHYVKVELDRLFGYSHFRNEIIWYYESGGRAKRYLSRKHDAIFWYARGEQPKFFPERIAALRNRCSLCGGTLKQWNHLRRHVDADGRVFRTIRSAGKEYRYYDDEPAAPADVWLDIGHIQQRDPQRVGYPTQKPEALIERLILALSEPDDVVADFFCGSGTTPAVAQRLGRRWIACDQSKAAVDVIAARVGREGQPAYSLEAV